MASNKYYKDLEFKTEFALLQMKQYDFSRPKRDKIKQMFFKTHITNLNGFGIWFIKINNIKKEIVKIVNTPPIKKDFKTRVLNNYTITLK